MFVQGMSIFFGSDASEEGSGPEIQWSKQADWKGFIEVAKNEGCKTIVLDELTFDEYAISRNHMSRTRNTKIPSLRLLPFRKL